MPPDTISRAAKTVVSLVTGARFPFPGGNFSALSVMRISRFSVLYSQGFLVYQVAIPLLDPQRFSLYKASPIPAIQRLANGSEVAAYIWPEHHYFAVSESNRVYMPIPQEKISKLRKINNLLILVNPEPIREIHNNAACEVQIAAGRTIKNPGNCDVRLRVLKDTFWLRLHKANTWIFSTNKPENIYLQCLRAEQITTTIKKVGVLELRPGCTAHTANAHLTASRSLSTHVNEKTFATVQINISSIIAELNESNNTLAEIEHAIEREAATQAENLHGIKFETLENGAGLRDIAARAREIAQRKETAFELKDLGKYTSWFGYSSTSLAILSIIIIIIILCIKRRCASSPIDKVVKQQETLMALEHVRHRYSSRDAVNTA